MNRRRLISTLLILSLLSALFPDRGEAVICLCRDHICNLVAGVTGQDQVTETAMAGQDRSCCELYASTDRPVSVATLDLPEPAVGVHHLHPITTADRTLLSSHMLCCDDDLTVRTAAVDVAPVPAGLSWSPMLFTVEIDRVMLSLELLASQHTSEHKVESSPPFMAAATRHTYLHTSAFLI